MSNKYFIVIGFTLLSGQSFGAQSYYCPQKQGYINIGMNKAQVVAACGQPDEQQVSDKPAMQKVAAQQLFFNGQGTPTAFYGIYAIPVGNNAGAQLEIDVVNNKVHSIQINGSNSNATSLCKGASIQPGDPVSKVTYACGSPSITNQTFIYEPIPATEPSEIWVYQPGPYQSAVRLTFVNGQLQSID